MVEPQRTTMTPTHGTIDAKRLEDLQMRTIGDVAGSLGLILAYMGDRLGLYRALAEIGAATSTQLAEETGLDERYVREWLCANAAAGYVEYAADGRFALTPEQAVVFAAEGHPACMQGFFQSVVSTYLDEPKVTDVFRTGKGLAWANHNGCLFCGTERFFRPM